MRPETHGTPRYLAWLYSPPPQRAALGILFELEREICAPARAALEHPVAHARLEWWRAECGRARSASPVHPLMRALAATAADAQLALDVSGLVDIATWDLACATFATRTELSAYCARWAAAVIEPAARLALPQAPEARVREFGRGLGGALRELELVIALDREAHAGRLRLPLDEIDESGIDSRSLAHPPWDAALAARIAARLTALRAALTTSLAQLTPGERAALRGLIVWGALALREARSAERALPNAWRPRGFAQLAAGWHGWRAARAAS